MSELRDEVFDGMAAPILDLISYDILGFQLGGKGNTDSYWVITPASPVLGEAFKSMMT